MCLVVGGLCVCLGFFFLLMQLLLYSFTVCVTVGFEAFAVSCATVACGQLGCSAGSPLRHLMYESCKQNSFLIGTVSAVPISYV